MDGLVLCHYSDFDQVQLTVRKSVNSSRVKSLSEFDNEVKSYSVSVVFIISYIQFHKTFDISGWMASCIIVKL